ncbi:teichoic acid glycosylation protein [Carnobacterium maltaromaticum]|uniref:GtrA family protein n=1 Tax=Carnobacterium maltaromaticum TaxID=2751 RepID=UPI000C79496C|nr:GtrA family protein [Carnobacterium maltaromaticum]PLS36906.1 teichoic acid glycosylation protein [Carnobacterium maltaromaticum]PLS37721.1 teichoic acid glycosylation protein [Carnobacterium maltaromaticum]PLS39662.1 teichoic acid glycosylation protein [Carnobacterium maltaromaticum]PLS44418.1 teichoic acid glycosylation protein [Carnobacterium maltaromaticum]PLS46452.1 teichoic acid glycosylation protein [Carnobacterium maltaromaticum]
MKKIIELATKYREVLMYLIFGVLTTIINIFVFYIFKDTLTIDYRTSNVIAWFLSVLFAFLTNKYFVFASKGKSKQAFFKEMGLFFWYRLLSLVIDMIMMIVMVSGLGIDALIAKLITQVVIVVINYVFSKLLIFNDKQA